jgi:hypothetical protein
LVLVGQPFTLSAYAAGVPAPSYTWYFNDGELTGLTGSDYVIARANHGHEGVYRIVATNSAGSAESSCRVSVSEMQNLIQNGGFESGAAGWSSVWNVNNFGANSAHSALYPGGQDVDLSSDSEMISQGAYVVVEYDIFDPGRPDPSYSHGSVSTDDKLVIGGSTHRFSPNLNAVSSGWYHIRRVIDLPTSANVCTVFFGGSHSWDGWDEEFDVPLPWPVDLSYDNVSLTVRPK